MDDDFNNSNWNFWKWIILLSSVVLSAYIVLKYFS